MESNNDTNQYSQEGTHRSRRSRRSHYSHRSSLKIWALSLALVVAIVVMFISFVYAGARIEELSSRAGSIQKQLILKEKEIVELKSSLTQSKNELQELIKGRLPSVIKLEPDEVLDVNNDLVKNIVFTVVNHDGARQYEYKLVTENHSSKSIVPKFRLMLFDKYGVLIGIDQVLKGEELAPGESRSYSSKVDFFMKEEPAKPPKIDISGIMQDFSPSVVA